MVRKSFLNRLKIDSRFKLRMKSVFSFLFVVSVSLGGCTDTPSTTEEHLAQGDEQLAQGKITEAVASYRMALHIDTLNPQVYASLSRAYKAQGKQVAADRYLRRAFNIPYDLGIRTLEAGDDSTAISFFEKTLDIFPGHPLALGKLADIHQAHGQFDKAILHLEKAAEADPNYSTTFVKLGLLYASQGLSAKAKDAFAKAIELNINASRAYLGLGQLHLDEGAWTDAIEYFETVLLINPGSPTAHLGISKAQSNLNNL